jgi:hypothetical protein
VSVAEQQPMTWPTLPDDVVGFQREVWVRAMCHAAPGQSVSDVTIANEMRVDKGRVRRARMSLAARKLWLWTAVPPVESGRLGQERRRARMVAAPPPDEHGERANVWVPSPDEIAREAIRIRMEHLQAMSSSGTGGGNGHVNGVAVHRAASFGSKRWNGHSY